MAGRESLPSSDRPDSNRRPPGPKPGALAYCATIRSRRGGWFGIHPAGARFRSCRAATLPSAEGRTYAKPPSATRRGPPEPHGTLRCLREHCGALCGPGGGRTRCLRVANATLYRLSYRPVNALPADSLAAGRAARCRIPRQRGANAFGVRVRLLGAFDEPHRGAGGSRTRVRKHDGMVFYVRSRRLTFMSASPATVCGSMVPGSYPAGLGRRLKCLPRFAAATGLGLMVHSIVYAWPECLPCVFAPRC